MQSGDHQGVAVDRLVHLGGLVPEPEGERDDGTSDSRRHGLRVVSPRADSGGRATATDLRLYHRSGGLCRSAAGAPLPRDVDAKALGRRLTGCGLFGPRQTASIEFYLLSRSRQKPPRATHARHAPDRRSCAPPAAHHRPVGAVPKNGAAHDSRPASAAPRPDAPASDRAAARSTTSARTTRRPQVTDE